MNYEETMAFSTRPKTNTNALKRSFASRGVEARENVKESIPGFHISIFR